MNEFRIYISDHDNSLENKIKQKLEPFCSNIYIVEEDGDAGLTISIISLVLSLPGFVVSIKEIMGWLNDKKKKSSEASSSITPFEWEFEIDGCRYNLEGVEPKEKQELLLDLIIMEYKGNG